VGNLICGKVTSEFASSDFYVRQHEMLCVLPIVEATGRPSVCPSICHTLVLCQRNAS